MNLDPASDERTLRKWKNWFKRLRDFLITRLLRFAQRENNPSLRKLADNLSPGRMTARLLTAAVRKVLKKTGRLSNC